MTTVTTPHEFRAKIVCPCCAHGVREVRMAYVPAIGDASPVLVFRGQEPCSECVEDITTERQKRDAKLLAWEEVKEGRSRIVGAALGA